MDYTTILSLRQPPNLLRQLTCAKFPTNNLIEKQIGLYKCKDVRCKLCKLYVQECTSFSGDYENEWIIKRHISCKGKMVRYYLICNSCQGIVSYTGKTNDFRK